MSFEDALTQWQAADCERITARGDYERAYTRALIMADGKSSEVRKAQADLAALEALLAYERATTAARALEHTVLHLRANAHVRMNVPPRTSVTPDGELRL